MAHPASCSAVPARRPPRRYFSLLRQKRSRVFLLHLGAFLSASATDAQAPQQQYVYGAAPVTTTSSKIAAYAKNGLRCPRLSLCRSTARRSNSRGCAGPISFYRQSRHEQHLHVSDQQSHRQPQRSPWISFFYRPNGKPKLGAECTRLPFHGKIRPVPLCWLSLWKFLGARRGE